MLRQVLRLAAMPLSWIPGGTQRAAYLAALGLVAIQVGIGIVLKIAQTDGAYSFSPSASVTISEFFKMLLSTLFFYRECKTRAASGILPATRGAASGYSLVAGGSDLPMTERSALDDHDKDTDGLDEANGHVASEKPAGPARPLNMRTFWSYFRGEVTVDVRYGFCNLAMFYVLINNSIFVSYKMADPGTIQLTKSGVTFITALVMIFALGTKISRIQWIAIIIQICGLMVTQYNPQTGTTYPLSTYLILLFQVFLSASSGVYNQALLKSDESSLHADNMILYAAGSSINLLVHVVVRVLKSDEPGFFEGYNSFGAVMVIVSNVFIGLAITAVYKYADAVIKCFATAVATGILLYVSPILFGTELSFLVLPGTVVVFTASWLYMDNPPPKNPAAPTDGARKGAIFSAIGDYIKRNNKFVLLCSTSFTVVVVAFLTMFNAKMPDLATPAPPPVEQTGGGVVYVGGHNTDQTLSCMDGDTLQSPMKDTLAMIRWNSPRPERVPLLMKYAPFFHTIHISMPGAFPEHPLDYHNITHDQYPENGTYSIYNQVARTMQLILDEQPEIKGLMYFHFDAWVNPLAWAGADPNTIWFPSILDVAPPSGGGPEFHCMTDPSRYHWWGWDRGFHKGVMGAQAVIQRMGLPFTVNPKEYCSGWSDIYYVPRRFFADYILLSDMMLRFDSFHEVAVPTMMHIIDQSRRSNQFRSAMDLIGDCWGSCCASNPTAEDVLAARCGHRIDYRQEEVANAFYNHLDEEARWLGRPANCSVSAANSPMGLIKLDHRKAQKLTDKVKKEMETERKKEEAAEKVRLEKEAKEKKEKEEKEAKEKAEKEANEKAEKEANEKAEKEANEKAEKGGAELKEEKAAGR